MLLASLSTLAGCGGDASETVIDAVVLESLPSPERLTDVLVTLTAVDTQHEVSRVEQRASFDSGGRLVPITVRLRPERADDAGQRLYRVRADGIRDDRVVITVQARVVFLKDTVLLLPLRFDPRCMAVACGVDQTCDAGACRDDAVDVCLLEGAPRDCRRRVAGDAGMDAARSDAGDAATVATDADPDAPSAADATSEGGPPVPCGTTCDDGDPCTIDACDASTGTCMRSPAMDDTACERGACCGGVCVRLGTDLRCGACGDACGANGACEAGVCECSSGFGDCDAVAGCETSFASDPSHCGTCTTVCAEPTPTCLDGTCGRCTSDAECPDDGLACTGPATCAASRCVRGAIAPGTCVIDGACWVANDTDPLESCRECRPADSATRWSAREGACDDGNGCTTPDTCVAGACATTPRNCDDALACTLDYCDPRPGMGCYREVAFGCFVDGLCFAGSDQNPANECLACDPPTSQTAWTPRVGSCDDGLFCTIGDDCNAGNCTSGPRDCSDAFACTTDDCDEGADSCTHSIAATFCLIDGACFASGAPDPGNPCAHCDPAMTQTDWSARVGPCTDGNLCTSDTCVARVCVSTPIDCDDGYECSIDFCDAGSCDHTWPSDACPSETGDPMVCPDDRCNPGGASDLGTCCNGVCRDGIDCVIEA